MKITFVLLAFFAFAESQNSNSCPSKEDIKPCSCLVGLDSKPWISCESMKSLDDLKRAVASMKGLSLTNFYLEKSNIGVLPSDIFSDMEIQNLHIMSTNVTKLTEDRNRPSFIGLENSLEYFEMLNSFVDKNSPLSFLSLSHLKKLTLIHIEENIIPTIGNNWFESGPYGLKELYFYNTHTTTVASHAFHAFQNLRGFALSGGFITDFLRDMLPQPATVLETIDLSKNNLATLPPNMFSKMPSLEEVYLEGNKFSTINEVVWAPVWDQLQIIFFYSNPIKCDKDLKWIYKYRLPEDLKGTCASPEKFLNRDLMNLTLSDLE